MTDGCRQDVRYDVGALREYVGLTADRWVIVGIRVSGSCRSWMAIWKMPRGDA